MGDFRESHSRTFFTSGKGRFQKLRNFSGFMTPVRAKDGVKFASGNAAAQVGVFRPVHRIPAMLGPPLPSLGPLRIKGSPKAGNIQGDVIEGFLVESNE